MCAYFSRELMKNMDFHSIASRECINNLNCAENAAAPTSHSHKSFAISQNNAHTNISISMRTPQSATGDDDDDVDATIIFELAIRKIYARHHVIHAVRCGLANVPFPNLLQIFKIKGICTGLCVHFISGLMVSHIFHATLRQMPIHPKCSMAKYLCTFRHRDILCWWRRCWWWYMYLFNSLQFIQWHTTYIVLLITYSETWLD